MVYKIKIGNRGSSNIHGNRCSVKGVPVQSFSGNSHFFD